MVDASMVRRLRRDRLALLGFEPFRHRVELLDVVNPFGKRAFFASHTCCHYTRLVIYIVGLVHSHFTIFTVSVFIFAHTLGARMAWSGLFPRQILNVREGISWVTIFLAIPVDVGPFVYYLSLSVLTVEGINVNIALVTGTSLLARHLANGALS